jgi:hypothetical protein
MVSSPPFTLEDQDRYPYRFFRVAVRSMARDMNPRRKKVEARSDWREVSRRGRELPVPRCSVVIGFAGCDGLLDSSNPGGASSGSSFSERRPNCMRCN